jgi:predicted MPP superfamily phosphohydrolase
MRSTHGFTIFCLVLFLLDLYVFQAVKHVISANSGRSRYWISFVYWSVSVAMILSLFFFLNTSPDLAGRRVRNYLFALIAGLLLAKLSAAIFLVIDDGRRLVQWIYNRFSNVGIIAGASSGEMMSRSTFLSWIGLAAGSTLLGSWVYGFGNKYSYKVRSLRIKDEQLPVSFRGLKIVQISDIHAGSFTDKAAVEKGVQKILEQQPDLILFTGDLVNDMATEMQGYMDLFARLEAPLGVYSILGNHDYGDYVKWPIRGVSKEQNLLDLQKIHADLGWKLLMNEHVVLQRGNDRIALIGVENWSAKSAFPKRGLLSKAYEGCREYPYKILMTHDPSHWEAEVQTSYPDINLSLSGHTHGMQFGVELPGFRWSPVQYVYKQWAGLYENNGQKLYVNRGFGFIGYPGRVGIMPEITVLELA